MPAIVFRIVDFPLPDGPTRTSVSPLRQEKRRVELDGARLPDLDVQHGSEPPYQTRRDSRLVNASVTSENTSRKADIAPAAPMSNACTRS